MVIIEYNENKGGCISSPQIFRIFRKGRCVYMNLIKEPRVCPKCGKRYTKCPALSRRDNKTEICPECGSQEAMEDFIESQKKFDYAEASNN